MQYSNLFIIQAEVGIRDDLVTEVQTCALPICFNCFDVRKLCKLGVNPCRRSRGYAFHQAPLKQLKHHIWIRTLRIRSNYIQHGFFKLHCPCTTQTLSKSVRYSRQGDGLRNLRIRHLTCFSIHNELTELQNPIRLNNRAQSLALYQERLTELRNPQ